MSVIRDARQVAASTTVTNLLTGSKFEFLARNSVVEVFAACDGTTLTADQPVMDVSFGNVLEADGATVPIVGTAQTGPNVNEHKIVSAVAQAGDRLQIKFTNNDTDAVNLRTLVKITAI